MKLKDAIMIPAMLAPMVPAIIMGVTGYGWFYLATIGAFYGCFGAMELWSKKTRNKTISRDIADTPAPLFWSIIGTWTVMHLLITLHWIMYR